MTARRVKHASRADGPLAGTLAAWRQENLGRLLLRAFQAFEADMLAGLERRGIQGLRLSHFAVLRNVDLGGSRVTAIAERAGLTKQAIGPLVQELVEAGVLSAAPDPADGRAKLVRFTPAGRRGLRTAQEVYARVWSRYEAAVGARRMHTLRSTLASFVTAVENEPESAEPRP